METHYYNTDYQYNAFKGQVTDNTREITKEEFYGKHYEKEERNGS